MNANTMKTVDAVKRIEREGDARGEHCRKLLEAIDELAEMLAAVFEHRRTILAKGWILVDVPAGFPRLARRKERGTSEDLVYANGDAEGNETGCPEWSLETAHALARDVAHGWMEEVARQIENETGVAAWDCAVIRAAVEAAKGGRC